MSDQDILDRARKFFVQQAKWDFAEHFDGWQCCDFAASFATQESKRAVREFWATFSADQRLLPEEVFREMFPGEEIGG